jgi:AraC family transcriptional regulator
VAEQNEVGELWKRFVGFCQSKENPIKHAVTKAGYEVWFDFEVKGDTPNKYTFVGIEVEKIEDPPLELVAKFLPETRYAVFTLKGSEIKTGLPRIWKEWLPESELVKSYDYLIEYYDFRRFKGLYDPDSELDFMVPVK